MALALQSIPLINKEIIENLSFPKTEVLNDKVAIQERTENLHKATSLGNLHKHKVEILFEDREGLKRVNTTIWAVLGQRIYLKGARIIPVQRIHSVELD